MLTVFDVASYILKKSGKMTTMKLQKLVYYSQAWALVWDEKRLFKERIEAWANGPVVRKLFDELKGNYEISRIEKGNPDRLSARQKDTIDAVLKFYGNKSAQWLIELSHSEEPWIAVRGGLAPLERGDNEIELDAMAEYYSSIQ